MHFEVGVLARGNRIICMGYGRDASVNGIEMARSQAQFDFAYVIFSSLYLYSVLFLLSLLQRYSYSYSPFVYL